MALKPTIYKINLQVADTDANRYGDFALTLAQHPSENIERMMARVLAFSLNAHEDLLFTKGLSSTDEPDIWQHSLDGRILLWIEVGEPGWERIKKASRMAEQVRVYSFNSKSNAWWQKEKELMAPFKVRVSQLSWEGIQALCQKVARTMDLEVTISGETLYVTQGGQDFEIPCQVLQGQ